MVSWAPGGLGDYTVEAQCRQIQFVDERFDNPDRSTSIECFRTVAGVKPCKKYQTISIAYFESGKPENNVVRMAMTGFFDQNRGPERVQRAPSIH